MKLCVSLKLSVLCLWSSRSLFLSLNCVCRAECCVCVCVCFFWDCLVFVGYDKALTVLSGSSERKKALFSAVLGV